jgi:hypothetical protein
VALDRLEAVHQHLLRCGQIVALGVSSSTCQALRATTVRAPQSCRASVLRSHHRCEPGSSVATLARSTPPRPLPRQRPTNTLPRWSSDSSAFAQYPIGWTHQHCRRLPALVPARQRQRLPSPSTREVE